AGGRSDQANITLDGVDINDQQTGGRSQGMDATQESALRITTESIEEFRITTTGANANQGRSSGAQISLVTKSGTNNLRGAAFYFKRPNFGSANNFFNNLAGIDRPSIDRDVYGGAIGGPIKRDKLFFFYSYEGQYQQLGVPQNPTVPLAHVGQGSIRFHGTGPSCVSGLCTLSLAELNSIYSDAGINPAAVSVLSSAATNYPSNNSLGGDGLNTGGFRFNSPTVDKENTHIARIDYNLRSNQQLYVRGNYQWDNETGASAFPDTPTTTLWEHPYGFVVGHNWTISNNKINNFRYGFTRQAFSQQGDSAANNIGFRFVYSPANFIRTLSRVTPVQNFTDDFTFIKGDHTWQFGGNVRIIRNERTSFANAYDVASANPSFYELSGAVLDEQITNAGYDIDGGDIASVQAAASALIGRFSDYGSSFTFDLDGSVLDSGTPSNRTFATEEYDMYVQDVWKARPSLTLTLGLRYALSRPVYEKDGFQVVPTERLGDFLDRRIASAERGVPLNDLIQFELGGPKNKAPGFYSMDWNNFQPRLAAAWSPKFDNKVLGAIFGKERESVFRGGFGIFNDYFGGQLAVSFDGLSTIGFTSASEIAANTYNVTDNLGPLFTGFGQEVRSLPGIAAPTLRFDTPADEAQRIESSLDATITSPTHYSWNVSWGRQLPKGMYFEASYIGRRARKLFGARDVMALNNLKDPASGMDWYTAAGILHDRRAANADPFTMAAIPYFENLFPGIGGVYSDEPGFNSTQEVFFLASRDGYDILDWTYIQSLIDDLGTSPNMFFHPQYAAFSAFGTFARSDYHGGTFTLRQRLGQILSYDINYTFSKSMDNVSGLQTDGSYAGQFLLNPLRPDDNYSVSDFDTKHVVNANFLFDLPVGRGRSWFTDMNKWADAFVGGWSLRGIYRWNSAQPISVPFDQAQWATNWNVQSNGTRIRAIDYGVNRDTQNIFADPQAAFNSFRNARPGETGERNTLRGSPYQVLDLGLSKTFTMPWNEGHKFQFRWEVFNVTNVQYFAVTNQSRTTYGLPQDPETRTAASSFGQIFTDIQGDPRRMQLGFRYSF
ncbi:MAG TPA: TonB-dependent receptor, partial [Pyrinomonadaceae bacterium]|nr:TonB-dependent receptor [Pyrinomonadaceae bacterium]